MKLTAINTPHWNRTNLKPAKQNNSTINFSSGFFSLRDFDDGEPMGEGTFREHLCGYGAGYSTEARHKRAAELPTTIGDQQREIDGLLRESKRLREELNEAYQTIESLQQQLELYQQAQRELARQVDDLIPSPAIKLSDEAIQELKKYSDRREEIKPETKPDDLMSILETKKFIDYSHSFTCAYMLSLKNPELFVEIIKDLTPLKRFELLKSVQEQKGEIWDRDGYRQIWPHYTIPVAYNLANSNPNLLSEAMKDFTPNQVYEILSLKANARNAYGYYKDSVAGVLKYYRGEYGFIDCAMRYSSDQFGLIHKQENELKDLACERNSGSNEEIKRIQLQDVAYII